ncbi:MAG: hypothetical protein K9J37_04550 [Saprospiraceae bacterium]|nr:hypothetical protein [Saprospiraceae bacterium]MCF8249156.1 hypothetical protein [Saprospiraceae bacterium]MCF8278902.1 hypothetical protein [Bacteroidales bacterium]MCF8311285.1 hypothetical protein [Saprospiraceae bacterium]MCF8440151.1 hypothetical protein [Saprospiraceae bacterium]
MAISATKWLTTCLHYNEHWETLLTKAVKPYTDVVLQTGVAECFFFERSMERGPHLRLWFKSTEFLLENMLKPNLTEHFQQYFEAMPSFLMELKYPASFPDKLKWQPNNSVQFPAIQEEFYPRIGQHHKIILEQQNQASSCMVLNSLKDRNGNWSDAEKISTAIKLHLGMIYAFGLTLREASDFTAWAYENWATGYLPKHLNGKLATEKAALQDSFQSNFKHQSKDVQAYHAAIWELLKNYRKAGDPAFVDWIHANTSTHVELSLAIDAGKLQPLPSNLPPSEPIWSFYADFIQKTNNRLGINGVNEGNLFFALAQSLKHIKHGNLSFSATESAKIKVA